MDSIQSADHAKRILEDTIVVEALQKIEDGLVQIWRAARSSDDREEVWYTLRGFELFKQCFEATISTGEFDKALLDKE